MKVKFNPKLIFIVTICVQFVVFCAVLTKNIFIKNNSIKNNRVYAFECQAYDPYNVLKGRYVQLNIYQKKVFYNDLDYASLYVEDVKNLYKNEKVYLLIKPDLNGFWKVYGVRKAKPVTGEFIQAKVNNIFKNYCVFDFAIDEYYMQENFADFVDKGSKFSGITSMKIEVYSDNKGNLLQKQLYVIKDNNFIPIENYIKDKLDKK